MIENSYLKREKLTSVFSIYRFVYSFDEYSKWNITLYEPRIGRYPRARVRTITIQSYLDCCRRSSWRERRGPSRSWPPGRNRSLDRSPSNRWASGFPVWTRACSWARWTRSRSPARTRPFLGRTRRNRPMARCNLAQKAPMGPQMGPAGQPRAWNLRLPRDRTSR